MKKILDFLLDNFIIIICITVMAIYGGVAQTSSLIFVAIPGIILLRNFGLTIFLTSESIVAKENMFTKREVIIIVVSTLLSIGLFWLIGFNPSNVKN